MNNEYYNVSDRLHTEVLETKYGSIEVEVAYDASNLREVFLKDKSGLTTTYAITLKNQSWLDDEEMIAVDKMIQSGEAIGRAFQKSGYSIRKNILDVHLIILPVWLQQAFDTKCWNAKTRISEFIVKKSKSVFNYATIAEVYSPDFKKPEVSDKDKTQINLPWSVQLQIGLTENEIWDLLSDNFSVLPSQMHEIESYIVPILNKMHQIIYLNKTNQF